MCESRIFLLASFRLSSLPLTIVSRSSHENMEEYEGDIAYKIDADQTLPLYRLLPPNKSKTKEERD
jgi:hypothetical protein